MQKLQGLLVASCLLAVAAVGQAQNTAQLSQNGWYSDDTRADGTGTAAAGTNLVSPTLTDEPEALSGNPAHDTDILLQISFGGAPGVAPAGTHRAAVHLEIGPATAGKSSISHRKDDATGHATGADAFGPEMWLQYHWMGDGATAITPGFKLGVRTAEFGLAGVSSRTGENAWDKLLIYEPGNLNGGVSNGAWFTEQVDYSNGRWWFFDRVANAGNINNPVTLSTMSASMMTFSGSKTFKDVYDLITAPEAVVTSVQLGIGSANANGSVYVNQVETSFYRPGSTTTFGTLSFCFGTSSACPCDNPGGPGEGCANSTGSGAVLAASGSSSVAADDLVLTATQVIPSQFGVFIVGGGQQSMPFGDGLRCVAPGSTGLHRFQPAMSSGPSATLTLGPGIVAYSQSNFPPSGHFMPGSTYYFQGWYRDDAFTGPCGMGFNLTNGVEVTFTF